VPTELVLLSEVELTSLTIISERKTRITGRI